MRIGVIGTGIAGLTAAWLFKRAGAEVTVFDKQTRLGMDAHSVEFEIDGSLIRTDVPPRMFNESLWPNLSRLYREIGVESDPVEPSKSFAEFDLSQPSNPNSASLLLKLGASYQLNLVPKSLFNASTRQILADIKRMLVAVPIALEQPIRVTMGEYLRAHDYSDAFIYQFLFPALSSTVCTCSYASLDAYPAEILLSAMLKLTSGEGLWKTRHGTQDVVRRLATEIQDFRLGTTVSSLGQMNTEATVEADSGQRFHFDHVIVATQANAAIHMLDPTMEREDAMLRHFRYENVPVVVHSDRRLVPRRRKDWSHFNLLSSSDMVASMCTIWMNRFCPQWQVEKPIFQTILPMLDPDPELVICSTKLQRPVVDQNSLKGLDLMTELHAEPNRRIWFCGSYASRGIPLLESAVVSSQNVAKKVGISWPDKCSV
jgi:predicted NAD/FAD-binding protein